MKVKDSGSANSEAGAVNCTLRLVSFHVQGLTYAEKQVNLLTAQVNTLEEEVRSRDALLQEVKDEMVRSTDVLKLAAQIKQVREFSPEL